MSRFARSLVAALIVLVLGALLVGGCGLRTPGGVRVDQRSVDTAADDPDIRKLPPGPAPGATPAEIVRGFLEAAAADPDHTIAQEYLASSSVWAEPDAVTVYDPESLSVPKVKTSGTLSRVLLTARSLGQVAAGGAFLPADRPLTVDYELRTIDGEWRLSFVPPGVLLTPRDLARGYRAVRTYNFTSDRSILVPEPGYVISDRAGLAGAALHALLTNWSGEGRTTVDPFRGLAPGLTALGSVVVRDGEATVDLGREAFNVPQQRRPLLVSQIAASLGSVPGVFTVRVLVEERPYVGGPVAATIPDSLSADSRGPALALSAPGGLVKLIQTSSGTAATQVRWLTPDGRSGATKSQPGLLADPVSSPGGSRLAALRLVAAGQQLVFANLSGIDALTATQGRAVALKAPGRMRYLTPQWLDANRLLLASTTGKTTQVQLVEAGSGALHLVSSPGLTALGPLSAFSVSRDGTRVIALAGAPGARRAYLGRVAQTSSDPDRSNELVVDGWAPVPTGMRDIEAVSWSGDLSFATIGQPLGASGSNVATALRAEIVAVDSVTDPTSLPALPLEFSTAAAANSRITVTTAPGRPTLVGLGTNTWLLRANHWLQLRMASAASNVSYP